MTTTDPWYPVTPSHPPPLEKVRAILTVTKQSQTIYNAQIIASRGKPPDIDVWAEWKDGRLRLLPAFAKPCLWQPQQPDHWPMALPEAVPGVSERLWSSKVGFALVDEATAAELAAEMESNREDARRRETIVRGKPKIDWWRDIDNITYEPPGAVTEKMAEGRVLRAVAMCGHGRDMTVAYRSFSGLLADMAPSVDDARFYADYIPRLTPLRADKTDFPEAMRWFTALNPKGLPTATSRADWSLAREQEVLIYRSHNKPLSFAVIGGLWEMTGAGVRQLYARAIQAVTRVANGGVAWPNGAPMIDHNAATKARNAAWKLKNYDPTEIQVKALDALNRGAA